jgi:PadR family transcriptional regulator PadR
VRLPVPAFRSSNALAWLEIFKYFYALFFVMSVDLGILQMQILWLLSKRPTHGYALLKQLREIRRSPLTQGTLYPALATLEKMRLIKSRKAGARGKKVYVLTQRGKKALLDCCREFVSVFAGIFGDFYCPKCGKRGGLR